MFYGEFLRVGPFPEVDENKIKQKQIIKSTKKNMNKLLFQNPKLIPNLNAGTTGNCA